MQDEACAKISAEMSKIIESTSENYSNEIRNYISNGRIFYAIDDQTISNIWIELMLSKNTDSKNPENIRIYIEIEHFLRGLALSYDSFIEKGGNVFSLLGTINNNEFDFFNENIESYNDTDLYSLYEYYKMKKKVHN